MITNAIKIRAASISRLLARSRQHFMVSLTHAWLQTRVACSKYFAGLSYYEEDILMMFIIIISRAAVTNFAASPPQVAAAIDIGCARSTPVHLGYFVCRCLAMRALADG